MTRIIVKGVRLEMLSFYLFRFYVTEKMVLLFSLMEHICHSYLPLCYIMLYT